MSSAPTANGITRTLHVEWFPPTPACPRCASLWTDLRESAGCGEIYSWAVVNRALHPSFAQDAPYVILSVDLEGAARMVGRLLAAGAAIGGRVPRRRGPHPCGFRIRRGGAMRSRECSRRRAAEAIACLRRK